VVAFELLIDEFEQKLVDVGLLDLLARGFVPTECATFEFFLYLLLELLMRQLLVQIDAVDLDPVLLVFETLEDEQKHLVAVDYLFFLPYYDYYVFDELAEDLAVLGAEFFEGEGGLVVDPYEDEVVEDLTDVAGPVQEQLEESFGQQIQRKVDPELNWEHLVVLIQEDDHSFLIKTYLHKQRAV
jgi:hypothetical protein